MSSDHYKDALTAAIEAQTKLSQLRETLRPAIEAALQKTWRSETERALVKAGKLLGVE